MLGQLDWINGTTVQTLDLSFNQIKPVNLIGLD
jgi:hypothetical protein